MAKYLIESNFFSNYFTMKSDPSILFKCPNSPNCRTWATISQMSKFAKLPHMSYNYSNVQICQIATHELQLVKCLNLPNYYTWATIIQMAKFAKLPHMSYN